MTGQTHIRVASVFAAALLLTAGQVGSASVMISQSTWENDVDLTAQGTVDWALWDTTDNDTNAAITEALSTERVEKVGGAAIGALGKLGTFADHEARSLPNDLIWSGGTPTLNGTAEQAVSPDAIQSDGAQNNGDTVDEGFTFDITGLQAGTVKVYTSNFKAKGTLRAFLKDNANEELADNTGSVNADPGPTPTVWTIDFSDPAAETLTVEWVNTQDNGAFDNVTIGGVAVVPEPASLALFGLGGLMMLPGRRRG